MNLKRGLSGIAGPGSSLSGCDVDGRKIAHCEAFVDLFTQREHRGTLHSSPGLGALGRSHTGPWHCTGPGSPLLAGLAHHGLDADRWLHRPSPTKTLRDSGSRPDDANRPRPRRGSGLSDSDLCQEILNAKL